MKIYSKILLTTLPLVFCLLLTTVGTAYYFSRTALTELAETWLETRLAEAMLVVANQADMLKNFSLDRIPASITKAKLDAGKVMATIEVGDSGHIFTIDRNGIIATHPDGTLVGRDISQESWFRELKLGKRRLVYETPTGRQVSGSILARELAKREGRAISSQANRNLRRNHWLL
jgi:signal transduction histidine kinase